MRIVEHSSVSDEHKISTFPNWFFLEDYFVSVISFFFIIVYCFGPSILMYSFGYDGHFLFSFLLYCGAFFLPMFVIWVISHEQNFPLNPIPVILTIINTIFPYIALIFYMYFVVFLGFKIFYWNILDKINIFGFFFRSIIIIYSLHLICRPIGLFYRAYEHRFVGMAEN